MGRLNLQIGKRLKKIRIEIFGEGIKLSAAQFAQLLNESEYKIRNYESGRSSVPVDLLVKLHHKGINTAYLLTGDGSVYAENRAGRQLREKIEGIAEDPALDITRIDTSRLSELDQLKLLRAVAGDILKKREEKE